MKTHYLALDLKDDPELIREYEEYHQAVWPEILESIKSSGILEMKIFRTGNRLFMVLEVEDHFSFERKNEMDLENIKVQQWESLMWKYQQALPHAKNGEKWILMDQIFKV